MSRLPSTIQSYKTLILAAAASCAVLLSGCGGQPPGCDQLTRYTRLDLMDWHIAGLWVINCPVAWVKVANYNPVPIKDITFQYSTYDINGRPLDKGTFTIEGTVPANSTKHFIELYLGLVDLYSERLDIKLISVQPDRGTN